MSQYSSQLQDEQRATDRAYARLDSLRAQIRSRLDAVRAAGSHGSPTQRTERDSFATLYEDRLTQLRAVEDRLVFGRLDSRQGEHRYVGRIGLSSEDHEPILTDWRADAARPFYEATPSHHGDIVMRRHITLSFRDVVAIEDEILDMNSPTVSQASQSGTLTGEGALLASLSSRRTGKMTDIVATIQAEQDRIIRSDMAHAVVVQGGPGTGKTAVALHRAAYLLYTHRRTLERSGVLIIGPSSAFLHYIDQVLPSLGETGVISRTIGDLIPGVVATAQESPRVAALKGDIRMRHAIANAVAARVRIPPALPGIHVNGLIVPILSTDIEQAQGDALRTHQPHNKARKTFVRSMMHALTNRYAEQLDYTPEQSELSHATSVFRLNDDVRKTLNLAWLPMNAAWLLSDMWAKPEHLRHFAPWLSNEQIHMLSRPKGSPFTISDIPLLDEAMDVLGPDPKSIRNVSAQASRRAHDEQIASETLGQAGIGNGIVTSQMLVDQMTADDDETMSQRAASDREWTYGHIVVDEAQELTAMDWRMLIRRCPSRSFTIVGDVAQTSALGGSRSWQKTMTPLFGEHNWTLNELSINYRNPKEVSDLSSRFAKEEGLYISTVNAVRASPDSVQNITVEASSDLSSRIFQELDVLRPQFVSSDGSGRIAIIAEASMIPDISRNLDTYINTRLNADDRFRLQSQHSWDRQIGVYRTEEVKGLEFDAVILVEPGLMENNAPSRIVAASDLYVSMTRPTQKLVIIRTRQDTDDLPL